MLFDDVTIFNGINVIILFLKIMLDFNLYLHDDVRVCKIEFEL